MVKRLIYFDLVDLIFIAIPIKQICIKVRFIYKQYIKLQGIQEIITGSKGNIVNYSLASGCPSSNVYVRSKITNHF